MDYLSLKIGNTPVPINGQIGNVEFKGTGGGQYGYGGYIIGQIITILIVVGVVISFFSIMSGGFKWLRSQGEPKKIEEARTTIIFSVVGLIVMFFAFFMIRYLLRFFHVNAY